MTTPRSVRKNRSARYGTSVLTHRETLDQLLRQNPNLVFLAHRAMQDGVSTAGSKIRKNALVFIADETEVIFTQAEARSLGLSFPPLNSKPVGMAGLM